MLMSLPSACPTLIRMGRSFGRACLCHAERPGTGLPECGQFFSRQSANVGRTLARLGVQLPIVLTEDDAVVNGIGRLEAAARKGRETIEAITVSPVKAEFARAMLNLLSMDFHFEGDNADMLRYGAFRRSRMRRRTLGTAYVIPVFRSPPQRRL